MAMLLHKIHTAKNLLTKMKSLHRFAKSIVWFSFGAVIGLFFFASFLYIGYQKYYANLVYIGVTIDGVDFGGKTQDEVRAYFGERNKLINQKSITFTNPEVSATISAKQIKFSYDENLLAKQAISVGKSDNVLSNISLMLQAYIDGVRLPVVYHHDEQKLDQLIKPLQTKIDAKPTDALFNFQNGRVIAFQLSKNGRAVDTKKLKEQLFSDLKTITTSLNKQNITHPLPIKTITPSVATDKANNLGVKELIAVGTSTFRGSIENRAYNINLAATRLNGLLIPPGQTFSFVKAIGDVSALTGYKQAYVIENGKTVLGDGGGVCQVSTTLFRAALNAGLPIVERNPHAYRVGYYEQDSAPGVDAAIYYPTVDLKFKNDTGHTILLQSYVDFSQSRLTFEMYGTLDGREVTVTKPIITSESPAPEPLYQDDPNLPKGQVKQIDFAAPGAKVFFTRTVKKNNKTVISDKFSSNYRPWQAIFLRGTKE